MTEQRIVNTVRSSTTHVAGRALNSAGVHHFVIDGTSAPKEEITPVDAFLAGISSCAVHMIERFADEEGVMIGRVEADITGSRIARDPSVFEYVEIAITVHGAEQAQAVALVERFKGR